MRRDWRADKSKKRSKPKLVVDNTKSAEGGDPNTVRVEVKTDTRPWFSDDSVQQILEQMMRRTPRARTEHWNPYIIDPAKFGPGAEHARRFARKNNISTMAMDGDLQSANQFAVNAWQAGGLLNDVASEGLLFLGYPYLSELAQRPEFRLFAEIRAEEMTRKWVKLRGTDDESTKEKNKPKKRNKDDEAAGALSQAADKAPRSDKKNKEIETKIKELEDRARDLKVREMFKVMAMHDSLFGIGHLFVGTKGVDVENPQDPEMKRPIGNGRNKLTEAKFGGETGFLTSLRWIEPLWCYPTVYNASNPLVDTWYDPQVWYIMGSEVHTSRLLPFIGRPVPDMLKPAYAFGGLSMTQLSQPYVAIWLETRQAVANLIKAFSVMILKTKLATTTMPGGAGGGGGDVLARLGLFSFLRDNQGVFALDKATEEFDNVAAPLGGLHELQAQAQEHMLSVSRIPAVKFTGIQPSGLNATSDGELRAFEDTIAGAQEQLFRPNLTTVMDLIQYDLWGKRDEDITYDFEPLREVTPKEMAEIQKLKAETAEIRVSGGVISQEEERIRLVNDEDSEYEHLDPDDVPDLLGEELGGMIPEGGGRGLEAILGGENPKTAKEKGKPAAKPKDKAKGGDKPKPKGKDKAKPKAKAKKKKTAKDDAPQFTHQIDVNHAGDPSQPTKEIKRKVGSRDDMPSLEESERNARITGGGEGDGPFDEFNESDHPRVSSGPKGGQFTSGGGGGGSPAAKPTASEAKYGSAVSSSSTEHIGKVAKLTDKPASGGSHYRTAVSNLISEAKKKWNDAGVPILKKRLVESWQITMNSYLKKGEADKAAKIAKTLKGLGVAVEAPQEAPAPKPAPTPAPAPAPAIPKAPGELANKLNEIEKGGGTDLSKGQSKVKAIVQAGVSAEEGAKFLSHAQKDQLAKQYGSVAEVFQKSLNYWKQEQEAKKSQAEKEAEAKAKAEAYQKAQAEAKAKEKAELEQFFKDNPDAKEAHEVVEKVILGGSAPQSYLDHAKKKIASAGLTGKMQPHEAAMIIAYSGSHYSDLNRQLRDGVMTEGQAKFERNLNAALDKLPAHKGTVFRKANVSAEVLQGYKLGMVVQERAFTSSSKKQGVWSGNVRYTIQSKTGRDIEKLSSHGSTEAEVLFKSGTRFIVKGVSGTNITLEEF